MDRRKFLKLFAAAPAVVVVGGVMLINADAATVDIEATDSIASIGIFKGNGKLLWRPENSNESEWVELGGISNFNISLKDV